MKNLRRLTLFTVMFLVQGFAVAQQPAATAASSENAPAVEVRETPAQVKKEDEGRIFTEEEARLLQELEKKRLEMERREQVLDLRERLLDVAEKRVADKLTDMEKIKKQIDGLLGNLSEKQDTELLSLAKIYEGMKPAAAAVVMNNLDQKIVYDVLKRMKQKNVAKVMEKMDPEKARIISEMMAQKRVLPDFTPAR